MLGFDVPQQGGVVCRFWLRLNLSKTKEVKPHEAADLLALLAEDRKLGPGDPAGGPRCQVLSACLGVLQALIFGIFF